MAILYKNRAVGKDFVDFRELDDDELDEWILHHIAKARESLEKCGLYYPNHEDIDVPRRGHLRILPSPGRTP